MYIATMQQTPQQAVLSMSSAGLTYRRIAAELAEREGISVNYSTIQRIGAGASDPAYSVGAGLIRLASQFSPVPTDIQP